MATTQRTRRNGNDRTDEMIDWSRGLGTEATRDAQEALSRSMRATVDTVSSFAEVGQRVGRELMQLSMQSTKEALRLLADIQGSTIEALQVNIGSWAVGQPAVQTWQRLLDGSARAYSRFAETVQGTAEEGTERIKDAVDHMAGQVKENAAQLAEMGDALEENRTSRPRASASSSSSRK